MFYKKYTDRKKFTISDKSNKATYVYRRLKTHKRPVLDRYPARAEDITTRGITSG
jgi:hypothetical protein